MADLTTLSNQAESDIAKFYQERHARCMALAANDRRTGNLTAHVHHMSGAALWRTQCAAALRQKRQREAEGFVYVNGFDSVRLFKSGRMLTPAETVVELAKSNGGAA